MIFGLKRLAPLVARLMLLIGCMTPDELRARTKKFASDVVQFCETLPGNPRAQEIAAQLVDATSGVGSKPINLPRPVAPIPNSK